MKIGFTFGFAAALLTLMAGCSQAPAPAPPAAPPDTRAADEKTIRDGEIEWVKEWSAKDVEKITSHYADEAILMAPGIPAMKGKAAIRAGLTEVLKDPNFTLTFSAADAEVSKAGDIAYVRGVYTNGMTDQKSKKPVTEKGNYVTVYKKQADGSWKAVQDINTSEAPAK